MVGPWGIPVESLMEEREIVETTISVLKLDRAICDYNCEMPKIFSALQEDMVA